MRSTPQSYKNGELVIVIDCSDLTRSARFWADVLYVRSPGALSLISLRGLRMKDLRAPTVMPAPPDAQRPIHAHSARRVTPVGAERSYRSHLEL
jgi:hypothetical protein